MDDPSFVTGALWHRPRRLTVQVRVRERLRKDRPRSGSTGGKSSSDSKDAARKLTLQMKEAKSAAELLDLLDGVVEGPIFNYFHASAAMDAAHMPGLHSKLLKLQRNLGDDFNMFSIC